MTKESGIKHITRERAEQISKHVFTVQHDYENYSNGELKSVAVYLITGDEDYWPGSWSLQWLNKFRAMPERERLARAGAMLAAEIDRAELAKQLEA